MKTQSTRNFEADLATIGGFSHPAKMPCASWSTPAERCIRGSVLRTMPGSVCAGCYALKGCYQFPSTQAAMARRMAILDRVLTSPVDAVAFVDAFGRLLRRAESLTRARIAKGLKPAKNADGRVFRFHDSGDLQSELHFSIICAIAEQCPGVAFWLPTREGAMVAKAIAQRGVMGIPPNLTVRVSADMVDATVPQPLVASSAIKASLVHSAKGGNWPAAVECGAYKREGECGPCRACWRPQIAATSYPIH
jgi:hypothetical protein